MEILHHKRGVVQAISLHCLHTLAMMYSGGKWMGLKKGLKPSRNDTARKISAKTSHGSKDVTAVVLFNRLLSSYCLSRPRCAVSSATRSSDWFMAIKSSTRRLFDERSVSRAIMVKLEVSWIGIWRIVFSGKSSMNVYQKVQILVTCCLRTEVFPW